MKNIKQIENNIKLSGLTGRASEIELRMQSLVFVKGLANDIFAQMHEEKPNWQLALDCLAHISEIFMIAERKNWFGFAEDFQAELFNQSPSHQGSYLQWRSKMFGDENAKQPENKSSDLSDVANQVAALMHNSALPEKLYNVIADEICELDLDIHSPENVLKSLEKLSQTTPDSEKLRTDDGVPFYEPLAERLVLILENGEVPENIKDALLAIVDEVISESKSDSDTSFYIRSRFAESMNNLDANFRKGIFYSLSGIMDKAIAPEIYQPIKKQTGGKVFY